MEQKWHILIRNLLGTGMTQAQVAAAIGVTQSAVSQVLNAGGKRGFGFTAGNALIYLHSQRCVPATTGGQVTRAALRADAHEIWPDVPSPGGNPETCPAAGAIQERSRHG